MVLESVLVSFFFQCMTKSTTNKKKKKKKKINKRDMSLPCYLTHTPHAVEASPIFIPGLHLGKSYPFPNADSSAISDPFAHAEDTGREP